MSNSSLNSPSTSSIASSRVTMPDTEPNSFTTIATWMPCWLKVFISGGTSNTSLTHHRLLDDVADRGAPPLLVGGGTGRGG